MCIIYGRMRCVISRNKLFWKFVLVHDLIACNADNIVACLSLRTKILLLILAIEIFRLIVNIGFCLLYQLYLRQLSFISKLLFSIM